MKTLVSEIMSTQLMTIPSSATLESAYQRMHKRKIRHLLVTNDEGELMGLISERDLQRSFVYAPPELASAFPRPSFPDGELVRDYMTSAVITSNVNERLVDAIEKMTTHKISSLVITNREGVCGILSSEDLLNALSDLLQSHTIGSALQRFTYSSPVGEVVNFFNSASI
jgi:acetoin utilization protein AcuB